MKNTIHSFIKFFDKFEDYVRANLSRWPVLYTFIGGSAIVLFYRGVWMTADLFSFMTGPVSILISVIILLAAGLFVASFVGDVIILSGLKKEKKLIEMTESEIKDESNILDEIRAEIKNLRREVSELKK